MEHLKNTSRLAPSECNGSTQAPSEDDLDPELRQETSTFGEPIFPCTSAVMWGDFASFEDMGFQNGGTLFKSIVNESLMWPRCYRRQCLLPFQCPGDLIPSIFECERQFSSTEVTFLAKTLALVRPLPWLNGSTSINPIKFFFRGSSVEWWFHTWGMPSSDTFPTCPISPVCTRYFTISGSKGRSPSIRWPFRSSGHL